MKKLFLIPLLTLMCSVMAWGGVAEDFVAYLQGSSTDAFTVSENIDLTAEGQHIVISGTKVVTIADGVTVAITSAYTDKEEEQPNGYDGHGFCFYVPEGANLTVKGNGTIAADRSVFFVAEGGELTIGEASKASQLNITTSEARVKQRIVVAKGSAYVYNANIIGRSGIFWNTGLLKIDGGTYLSKSSDSDRTHVEGAMQSSLFTYALNAQGSTILKNATIKAVHGGVCPAANGKLEIDNCTIIADPAFADYSGAASYHAIYGATYGVSTARNSKFFSKSGYAAFISDNDSQTTFAICFFYENCYFAGGSNANCYPQVGKRKAQDAEILFPIEIDPSSAWYTIAQTGGRTPLPNGITYEAINETIEGRTYKVKTVGSASEQDVIDSNDPTIPWQQQTTWASDEVPDNATAVTIPEGKTVVVDNTQTEKTATANQVYLSGEGASLTVQDGTTLNIDNNLTIATGAKVVVEAGAVVTVGAGGVTSSSENAVEVKMTEGKTSTFMIAPTVTENTHPMAKVELVSKAYKRGEGDFVYQRFGVPAYMLGVKRSDMQYDHVAAPTAVWKLDYSNWSWANMEDDDEFIPFYCYELTTTAATPGAVYTFTCPLMGNGNAELELNGEWNYYANSYTAPIDVKELINSFVANYDAYMSATVYLYRAEDDWWYELNDLAYLFDNTLPTKIQPMQAFIFQKRGEGANPEINFKDNVWDPIMNPTPSSAPARNRESYSKAMIEITAADGTKDAIRLVENGKFSSQFDNSFDATKYMNEKSFNLFVDANNEKLGSVASDNLDGTLISMTTKAQTSFTMTISNVNEMNYAIRDNLTGTEIEMVEGATYMFSVPANANVEGRFEVIGINKMPTAIENIEETVAVKGIYTLSGQFVGNDYHSLPAGVYVVDGKKIVK